MELEDLEDFEEEYEGPEIDEQDNVVRVHFLH